MRITKLLYKNTYLLLATVLSVSAEIKLPAGAVEYVRWSATEVESALKTKGVTLEAADIRVVIGAATEGIEAQAFALARTGPTVTIDAGAAPGAMYGLLELAEQIRAAGSVTSWAQAAEGIKATNQKPYIEIRADNPFIHYHPLLINDLEQWRAYIDMLARNRFNLLDLHGAYDFRTTSFPNLYPALIHVPEYPHIGNATEQARNLASFQAIIAYAKSRGIRVAFMNYSANDNLSAADSRAPSMVGIPVEKLADYTAKAVTGLIRALPDLYMLGFRVGESGREASFFQDSYIKGVRDADRADLRLYTRSWLTTKKQLLPIAEVARAGFDIEVKYNGEQLGLPYHALQTNFGTYSYESYLDVPANYRIIWQVRANGTHRFWAWEDTDFIRRTVRTLTLGNARGFTIEPQTAYFSTDPASLYREAGDRGVYRYVWQKYWAWYAAWGRMSFDPELPEPVLVRTYQDRFGSEAGKIIYSAMQQASVVVPLVLAYRFPGPDHRNFSPETETGNLSARGKEAIPVLLQFIDHHPEDERSFASIGAYVEAKLAHRPDGRVGPFAVAARLHAAARQTRELVASVPALAGSAADEWRLLKADLVSASWLGDYYASRITGLVHLAYALKTGYEPDYTVAQAKLADSRIAWKRLGETADAVYGPLSNPLRKQLDYQWGAQLGSIDKVDATAAELWSKVENKAGAESLPLDFSADNESAALSIRELTHSTSAARDVATIQCRPNAAGGALKAVLWFKPLPSQLKWQSREMELLPNGAFTASTTLTPEGLMYLVEIKTASGLARNFPAVFEETPYRIIPAFLP